MKPRLLCVWFVLERVGAKRRADQHGVIYKDYIIL